MALAATVESLALIVKAMIMARSQLTPLYAIEDTRVRPRAVRIQDLDCNQLNVLGYAISPSANRARDMSAMAILIRILVDHRQYC